jgi:hypothetical protein
MSNPYTVIYIMSVHTVYSVYNFMMCARRSNKFNHNKTAGFFSGVEDFLIICKESEKNRYVSSSVHHTLQH